MNIAWLQSPSDFSYEQKCITVLLNKPACLFLNSGNGSSKLQVHCVYLPREEQSRGEQLSVGLLCGFTSQLLSKAGDLLESTNRQVKSPAQTVAYPSSPFAYSCAAVAVWQDDWADSPSKLGSFGLTVSCFIQLSVSVITQPAVCGL